MTTDDQALGSASYAQLGEWVELHQEQCRGGRVMRVAVNRRDGCALELTEAQWQLVRRHQGRLTRDHATDGPERRAFLADLRAEGFLTERLEDAQPRLHNLRRFAGTLDVRWRGADRLVHSAYRRGLRHAFTRPAMLVQVMIALAGVVALVAAMQSDRPLALRVSPANLPLVLGLALTAIVIHELAHGLVLVHFGRGVHAAGIRLHLGTPAFYVESADALLLSRRQRMLQAAAGPWAEWLVTSVVGLLLWLVPCGSLTPLLHRFVILNTANVLTNLVPFVGLDGSWLLADAMQQPDLQRRSRTTALSVLRDRRLPAHGEKWLCSYAAMNIAVASALLSLSAFFWWELFGDSMARIAGLGAAGWLMLTALGLVLLRPAISGLVPGGLPTAMGLRRCAGRIQFRLERRWRVHATELLRMHPLLHGVDEHGLGVVAGRVQRHRLPSRHGITSAGDARLAVVLRGRGAQTLWSRRQAFLVDAGAQLEVAGRRVVLAVIPVSMLPCGASA